MFCPRLLNRNEPCVLGYRHSVSPCSAAVTPGPKWGSTEWNRSNGLRGDRFVCTRQPRSREQSPRRDGVRLRQPSAARGRAWRATPSSEQPIRRMSAYWAACVALAAVITSVTVASPVACSARAGSCSPSSPMHRKAQGAMCTWKAPPCRTRAPATAALWALSIGCRSISAGHGPGRIANLPLPATTAPARMTVESSGMHLRTSGQPSIWPFQLPVTSAPFLWGNTSLIQTEAGMLPSKGGDSVCLWCTPAMSYAEAAQNASWTRVRNRCSGPERAALAGIDGNPVYS